MRSTDFLNTLILPANIEYHPAPLKLRIDEPTPGQWSQVHPDKAYHLYPVPIRFIGNQYYLVTSDMAAEMPDPWQRSAIIVVRSKNQAVNPAGYCLWVLRLNGNRPDEQTISHFMRNRWSKIHTVGSVVEEEQDTPEQRIEHASPFVSNVLFVARKAVLPPAWSPLPAMENLISASFRGHIISSFDHPALWTV
jgi:hypothetical protein